MSKDRIRYIKDKLNLKYTYARRLDERHRHSLDTLTLKRNHQGNQIWGYKKAVDYFFSPLEQSEIQVILQENNEDYDDLIQGNWSPERAAIYIWDKTLDREHQHNMLDNQHNIPSGTRYEKQSICENCDTLFFYPLDKKGYLLSSSSAFCLSCTEIKGYFVCLKCGQEMISSEGEEICISCFDLWAS